jgi:phage antirepressor YoqD-like protein/phage anti-repressor protein
VSALIPAGQSNEFPVDARFLHANLGYTKPFSTWIQAAIERFGFSERIDFLTRREESGGRPSVEYRLTQNAAKVIQIAARGEVGDAAREGAVKLHDHVEAIARPSLDLRNPAQLQRLMLELGAIVAEQGQALALAAPKVAAFDAVMSSEDLLSIAEVSNLVSRPGHPMGEIRLFRRLRELRILQHNNRPFQEHIDAKRFVVRETSWTSRDGTSHVKCQTLATTRGAEYVRRRLDDSNGQRSLLPVRSEARP